MTKEQILRDNITNFDVFKEIHSSRYEQILRAMDQYGKEQRIIGDQYGVERGNIADRKEITRLRSLVQAQKEYIIWLQVNAKELTADEVDTAFNFKDKIKELES